MIAAQSSPYVATKSPKEEFEVFFDLQSKKLLRYIELKVADKDAVEDIASSAFLKYWTRLTSGQVIQSPRALLYTITYGLIVDYYRDAGAERERVFDITKIEVFNVEEHLDVEHQYSKVLAYLQEIKSEYREVLILHYVEGFDVSSIADILEETENNIRVRLHRALTKLRSQFTYEPG